MESSDRVPDRPVKALLSSLRPVNLNSSLSTPPVFTCIVTDYSSNNGQQSQVSSLSQCGPGAGLLMITRGLCCSDQRSV